MKKNLLPFLLFPIGIVYAQDATKLKALDTRDVNDLPNAKASGLQVEFKKRATIGVPGSGNYSANLTISPWTSRDNSGGENYQLNFNREGMYYRNALPLNAEWGAWQKVLLGDANGVVSGLTTNGEIKNTLGSGAKLTLFDNAEGRNNRIILFANENGANIQSTFSSGGVTTINFLTAAANRMIILGNGNIGIGTLNPDAKLAVKGNIHAQEVKVDLAVPADYVFQKYYTGNSLLNPSYQFKSLEEIKAFTVKNHHLPDLPSAKEIQENGLKVGEMNNLLLQKIEELTLHLIEQNEKIEELTHQIQQLKQK
ncbi:hypothetical protein [Empedobacter brevis]|uniref:hypothetical protein n=2 Tax=Empedobacter brevis TaxID=247 RepID=UPI0003618495|nr:hypothetical protein [Empedobacter brevis]